MNCQSIVKNKVRVLMLFLSLLTTPLFHGYLFLFATAESVAGYCDGDNDNPDPDDFDVKKHPECQKPLTEKNLGGSSPSCPDSNAQQCKIGHFSGNPINNSTGNKFQEEVDYISSGVYPLKFIRYYNSQSTLTKGALGANWSHSYSAKISKISATQVKAVRADQKTFTFNKTNGVWTSDADVNSKLKELPKDSGWLYTTGADEVETYGGGGRLLSIANRAGLKQKLVYDTQGQLRTVTDPFGTKISFFYDGQKRIKSFTAPQNTNFTYQYKDNKLSSVTDRERNTRQYLYEDTRFPNAMTALLDEENVRFASWSYDTDGWAKSSRHVGGFDAVTLEYDKLNLFVDVTNALGDKRRYTFQTYKGASHTVFEAPAPQSGFIFSTIINEMHYDGKGNVISHKDVDKNSATFKYEDPSGRNLETSRTEPIRGTTTTDWHEKFWLPTTITQPNISQTRMEYDNLGHITALQIIDLTSGATNGGFRSWFFKNTYDPKLPGALKSVVITDPKGEDTTIDYYLSDDVCRGCRGQVKTISNPLGHLTQFTHYNDHGLPTTIIDPNKVAITLYYDSHQRLNYYKKATEITRWHYNKRGLLDTLTRSDGSQLTYTYYLSHYLKTIKDSLGKRIKFTPDLLGNPLRIDVYDKAGLLRQTHQYAYYANGRLKSDTNAEKQPNQYVYTQADQWGNLWQIKKANNLTTTYGYDDLNRLKKITDPLGLVSQQGFDALDNLKSVIDPNNKTTGYLYNGLNNLISETSPDRGKINYSAYDSLGNPKYVSDARGYQSEYTYDKLGRVLDRTIRNPSQANSFSYEEKDYFSYDNTDNDNKGIGRLTEINAGGVKSQYKYDKQGRIVNMQQTTDLSSSSLVQSVQYNYDTNGQLLTLTYPSGLQIGYDYEIDGNIKHMTVNGVPLLNAVTYHPFGPAKSWKWEANLIDYVRTFDKDGRLQTYPLGDSMRTVGYDRANRVSSYTVEGQIKKFVYDDADRLTFAWLKKYRYGAPPTGDKINRTSYTNASAVTSTWTIKNTNN